MVRIIEAKIGNHFDDTHKSVFYAYAEWDQVIDENFRDVIRQDLQKLKSFQVDMEYLISINEIVFIDMSSDKSACLHVNACVTCYSHIYEHEIESAEQR